MSFSKTFCSSPWLHMRVNNDGSFDYCRWSQPDQSVISFVPKITDTSLTDYFTNSLAEIRLSLLEGKKLNE